MAIKSGGKYKCSVCSSEHTDPVLADSCRDSHSIVLVTMTEEELSRLVQYIYTKDESVLPETLPIKLNNYLRNLTKGQKK